MKYFRATYLPDVLSSTGKSLFVKSLSALQLSNFSHWEASFLLMLSLICLWGQKDTMRNPDLLFMVHLTTHLSESLWTKIMGDIPQHYLKNQTHITEMLPKSFSLIATGRRNPTSNPRRRHCLQSSSQHVLPAHSCHI